MNKLERIACLYLTFLSSPGGLSFARIRELLPTAYETKIEPKTEARSTARGDAPGESREDMEAARRKFERDKDELRALGMELRYCAAGTLLPDGRLADESVYVVVEEHKQLPEIQVNDAEFRTLAAVLLRALSGEASEDERERSLLEAAAYKLLYRNPAVLERAPAAEDRHSLFTRQADEELTDRLAIIHDALSRRRVLRLEYVDKAGRPGAAHRRVAGRGLISHRGRWCLVAYCYTAQDIRSFYVDRMRDLTITEDTYPVDRNFNIKNYSLHPLAVHAGPAVEIRLTLAPDKEEAFLDFLQGVPPGLAVHQHEESGRLEIRLRSPNPGALFAWMLRHPGIVTTLGPPELRERYHEHVAAIRRQQLAAAALGGP